MNNPVPGSPSNRSVAGVALGLSAYLWWGLSPIYFKTIAHINPVVVVSHRVVWSVLLLAALLSVMRDWPAVLRMLSASRTRWLLVGSTVMIAINWGVFIDAIAADQLKQASLGYFINPIVSAALGLVFLRERLNRMTLAALLLAALGVIVMTWGQGQLPWRALALAFSFGIYGLLRKFARAPALAGLMIETAALLPVALILLALLGWRWNSPSPYAGPIATNLLLLASGIVTTVPLLCFTAAAARLRLITLGMLQYIGPTVQFILALAVFNESFDRYDAIAFSCIWAGIVLFSIGTAWNHVRRDRTTPRLATVTGS